MGKKKIEIEKIKEKNTQQVTFSKRRNGLFKKAGELAILCNAEVAIAVFSPGGKPYLFGNPCFNSIVKRFEKEEEDDDDSNIRKQARSSRGNIISCQTSPESKRLQSIKEEISDEIKKELRNKLVCAGEDRFKKPIKELSLEELKEFETKMKKMHVNIQNNIAHMNASSGLMRFQQG